MTSNSTLTAERAFQEMTLKHIQETIVYLFDTNRSFGVLCNIQRTSFDPELPEGINSSLQPLTLFFLAGHTFQSAHIEDKTLIFEAGFGNDSFGSVVSVPLLSIFQIIVDESPIFLNNSAMNKKNENLKKRDHSMETLLSNPENKKFIKNRK